MSRFKLTHADPALSHKIKTDKLWYNFAENEYTEASRSKNPELACPSNINSSSNCLFLGELNMDKTNFFLH